MADHSKHQNHRPVTIFRTGSNLSRVQGAEVDDFFADSKQGIGSYFESGSSQKVGTGLETWEEELLLPAMIDYQPDDREFRKKVTEYYCDINTNIPHGTGLTLETGLTEDNEKPVSKTNRPLVLADYLKWRHAQGHPWVAANQAVAKGDQQIKFYIFDKSSIQAKNSNRLKDHDAAMQIYLKVKNDTEQVDQMLTLLGVDVRIFTGKDKEDRKIEALRAKVDEDALGFAKVHTAGDLELRATIKGMLLTNVLKQVGSRIIDVETEEVIGNTEEETFYWFKDDEHSMKVATLKARLQEGLAKKAPIDKRKTVLK